MRAVSCAHAAAEIAGARGDAGLAGAEDAHVSAIAGAAGRRGHDGAGLEQGLRVAGPRRRGRDALRARRDQQPHPRRDAAPLQHARRLGEIVERAVGAGADKRLLDRLACGVGDRHGVADDPVGQRQHRPQRAEIDRRRAA